MLRLMEEWCRWNIVWWGEILEKAERSGNQNRAEYARWMLEDVLK